MIMTLRTAEAMTELKLLKPDGTIVKEDSWESGRQLSGQLLEHLSELLTKQGLMWSALTGVVVFRGPGSFTGLRIGVTVANAIAYAQEIPIVGTQGDDWLSLGVQRLVAGQNDTQVTPHYGAAPHITKPAS